ncbi:MAG: preprotein translocase subunit YajC [Planctomycetota bacterium]
MHTQPFPMTIMLAQSEAGALPAAPGIAGQTGSPATGDAATVQPDGSGNQTQQSPPPSPFGGGFLFILMGLFAFMIIMSVMSGRKEKRRRADMLSSLNKHDRVLMGGGIIGTLMEIREDEVIVKVDENTRITFSKAAVQQVLKHSGQTVDTSTAA